MSCLHDGRFQSVRSLCVCCAGPETVWDNHIQRLHAWTLSGNEGNTTRETALGILVSVMSALIVRYDTRKAGTGIF